MKYGVNRVTILGVCGGDPLVNDEKGMVRISVATNEQWKDKAGNIQRRAEWHRVVLFNKLAKIASQYIKKGSNVYICGSLRTSEWTDKNNITQKSTDIIASEIRLLDRKG